MPVPDLSPLRARFPALTRTQEGRPCVFADAPGGSQVPDVVLDAIRGYLVGANSNTHGAFATSRATDALITEARAAAAGLLGGRADEIVFGQNATTLLFAFARSFARTLGPGDQVVVTKLDHDANIRPWVTAAEDAGATVTWIDVHEGDVTLDLQTLDAALSDRTRLVAVTLASNAVGTITPAAEIVRRAHAVGALVCVDAVHLAQHRRIDVRAIGADLAVCSPYKVFGPHLGILWARPEVLSSWRPYKVLPSPDTVPERWETGTLPHEALAGFVASVGYLAELGRTYGAPSSDDPGAALDAAFTAIAGWESELTDRFLAGLAGLGHIRLFGIADRHRLHERTPTFAVRVGDQEPALTSRALGERGIFTWDGHYYALELMERLGLEPDLGGAVRIGFCHYSTPGEVDRVLEHLADLP